ncbi:tRNA (adenine-N1)-methyltransferase [Thermodesulfatator autotrophicus]|uniref:tRNA (adenine(58)-N(1))-methyltransferase TrmI n=1 Tax=Thermodesulfatator autotrophicus TaxID=1795632 RepID=A0A177E7Z7_9BACT|nr:tRNA (adenine-N1)-methyltransferase [Thermodesulfatator autotrophicus]OAG27560.1 tRNA (adenine-N1)-methyltransferase [Thermodesulfatator autotrophicus]
MKVNPGDLILFCTEEGRTYLIEATAKKFQTHRDSFNLEELIGKPYGSTILGAKGTKAYALKPTVYDYLMKLKRVTQIIYPKDIGYILLRLDAGPGKTILECGTGSGSLLIAFAHAVGKDGRVISYEKEKRFQEVALENLTRFGLAERVIFKGEAQGSFDEKEEVDAVFLDLKTPWDLLKAAWQALKPGCPLGVLLPTANQVSETLKALEELPFVNTEVLEIMLRFYKTNPERLRPEDRMVAHTAYLLFSRKIKEA